MKERVCKRLNVHAVRCVCVGLESQRMRVCVGDCESDRETVKRKVGGEIDVIVRV